MKLCKGGLCSPLPSELFWKPYLCISWRYLDSVNSTFMVVYERNVKWRQHSFSKLMKLLLLISGFLITVLTGVCEVWLCKAMTLTYDLGNDIWPDPIQLQRWCYISAQRKRPFNGFFIWWPWPLTYDLDQWRPLKCPLYGSIQKVLGQ